ncbi:MAG TPA: hypothetical protein DCG47_14165 [Spirochaetaceae bacterium]|jgi:hypothetical protein|nr:hypothetical protein [Spirochaetaceae bacterium]
MRTQARAAALTLALVCLSGLASAQALRISPEDLRVEQRGDEGYHLFIRAKPGMGSVLLTETTKDPQGKADNYAYRAEAWNPVNGDEPRKLDGAFMNPSSGIYSLIDSSPEPDGQFGAAFHVFIPWIAQWGYAWSRNGREFIADGSFINIRAFALPYADYAGAFADNPFVLSVTQRPFERPAPAPKAEAPAEPDLSAYMPETVRSFEGIAEAMGGISEFSMGKEDIVPVLARILDELQGDELELVICLDTTDSMADDIDAVKDLLPRMIAERTERFKVFKLGLVLYKDYFEEYVVKRFEFTSNTASFTSAVNSVKVRGGRDIPEAVYEALYEALIGYAWSASTRAIVLIGDAPPHPLPRGRVDKAKVTAKAAELGVSVNVIILPH